MFELYPVSLHAQVDGADGLTQPTVVPPPAPRIHVPADGEIVWVAQQTGPKPVRRVGRAADAGFCQVRRRESGLLAMITQRRDRSTAW
jgi:hypothetical protein